MEHGGLKFINRSCITFSESRQGNNNKGLGMMLLENMEKNTQFEVEVPTIDTNNSDGIVTEASYYHLTHDKLRRNIVLY